jgi:hypothetical protein
MMANQPEAFVRAKPRKISITETYRYKADVSDYIYMPFVGAEGEIKIEFVYDGELRDFRWKLRAFWDGLLDKWELLKWLKNWFQPKPGDKKFFGVAAIADAEKYGDACRTARVGHLALRGYRKPNFEEDWPENQTIELKIPVDGLKQNLAQSQKYELSCRYPLREPKSPLIRLSDVALTDETLNQGGSWIWLKQAEELHSERDEILQLKIKLVVDGGQPDLDADNKVPSDVVKRWWREGKRKKPKSQEESEEKEVPGSKKDGKEKRENSEEEQPAQEQISCLDGLPSRDDLCKKLKDLALRRGGYLLIHLAKSDDFKVLKKQLLEAAFHCTPFIPIFEPYEYELDHRPLVVVPVPMLLPPQSAPHRSRLCIESDPRSSVEYVDKILERGDTEQPVKELAWTLSALANTVGGKIFWTAQRGDDRKVLEETVRKARLFCKPRLDLRIYLEAEREDGWILRIERASSQVYSVDGIVYTWEDGKLKELSVDEIYRLIEDRCTLYYPFVVAPPLISHAHLGWSGFNGRETRGVRYDPQKETLKWSEGIRFWQTPEHRFEVTLPLLINRPIELYRQSEIKGQVHIELKDQLRSGLDIDYFNVLGEQRPRPQGGPPIIEKKSKIELEFDITRDAIFKRRRFTTSRKLEFEGVKPDRERLKDIQGMLADLGLENIDVSPANPWLDDWFIFLADDPVKIVMDNGGYRIEGSRPNLRITLHVEGELRNIYRERKQGDRVDRMRLQAGGMQITIKGEIRGESPQELSVLLNRLQRLLKERFSYLRFQVA